ncbi:MAG: MFS transporter [Candidatus Rokubacteria bacterium]|nr:MFS transporter [Candidatus Rokubacteria bacterium]
MSPPPVTPPRPGPRTIAATFVTLGLAYGVWYAYSVFLVALLAEFGWSRSLLAGAFSVFTLVHGILSAPLGWLADRLGPRRLVLAGGTVLAGALVLDGAISRPWHLYAAFGLLTAIGVASSGWLPAVVMVQRWYPQRVGTALGLTSAGIGVGIFLVVPLCQTLINLAGWRWAFRTVGVIVAAWVIPATLWLVRDPPPSVTSRQGTGPVATGPAVPGGDVTLRGAGRTSAFWLLATAQVSGAFVNQMLLVHQVAYLVDHGISALVAAGVVGVVGIASVVGKAGGGWFSDTFGREVTYTLGNACVMLSVGALGLLALGQGAGWAYGYGVLIGVGYAVTAPLIPALVADLFRGQHFGAIFGTLQIANAIGGSLGPWIAGRVFDASGSYAPAFTAAVASAAVSMGAVWLIGPRRR